MQTNVDGLSIRERFELHSETDSSCFGCHQVMDPIGFALEQYDSVGRWKQEEQGKPVDASGKLPDGREFFGASEMAEVLSKDDLFAECLAEKMLVYATGRGMDVRAPGAKKAHGIDSGQVLDLAAKLKATNYSSRELIVQVVLSKAFRQRTPEPRPK